MLSSMKTRGGSDCEARRELRMGRSAEEVLHVESMLYTLTLL